MAAVLGPCRRLLVVVLAGALLTVATVASARAGLITVRVDQARLLKLPEGVSTIVIGNPLIADATLQAGNLLVVTGKGYGLTNLLALDRKGKVIMREAVRVMGPAGHDLVVVYKGVERETYSCAPQCLPRITLGDANTYFTSALAQTAARNGQAQQSGSGGGGAPAPK
jgi:hypothetical protein